MGLFENGSFNLSISDNFQIIGHFQDIELNAKISLILLENSMFSDDKSEITFILKNKSRDHCEIDFLHQLNVDDFNFFKLTNIWKNFFSRMDILLSKLQ